MAYSAAQTRITYIPAAGGPGAGYFILRDPGSSISELGTSPFFDKSAIEAAVLTNGVPKPASDVAHRALEEYRAAVDALIAIDFKNTAGTELSAPAYTMSSSGIHQRKIVMVISSGAINFPALP